MCLQESSLATRAAGLIDGGGAGRQDPSSNFLLGSQIYLQFSPSLIPTFFSSLLPSFLFIF